ncbi:MAG: DUF1015 family protein [Acidimicrobiaceae bacterium]|nr:DUF1015 family protein [Acidimicrobiaceae bacterium]MDE0606680.1 DUF1015 family protein [Acidimicrobiaceae bacterium]
MSSPLLAPFQGWLIRPEWAERVIASATDSKTPEQRRGVVEGNPFSYLGVTRSPEDLSPECDIDELVALSTGTFRQILSADAFKPSDHAAFYVYRMSSSGDGRSQEPFSQIGIVGALDIEGLHDGRVLTHENVRPERASLLTDHLNSVGATSSPISLTHVAMPELQQLLTAASMATPDIDVVTEGIRNQVWTLGTEETSSIQPLLEDLELFVTDGHHRCAAAIGARNAHQGNISFSRTLAVLFPHDHLRVEAFHRRAPDSARRSTAELVAALQAVGTISAVDSAWAAQPRSRGEVGVYHQGCWFRLRLDPPDSSSTLASLDVERLRVEVIGRVLGVDELREDSDIDYVPAPTGVKELTARCDTDGFVGLLVYPTDITDIMAVAASGELMPPKSSFLYPKAPAGVFLQVFGVGATDHLSPS